MTDDEDHVHRAIDELLSRAVEAVNRGDITTAHDLANRVLASDASNLDAGTLLSADLPPGELRRLTIVFCDLVDSTALSGRLDPESYRTLLARYKAICRRVIEDRSGGHIAMVKGDGILAIFGAPVAREHDAQLAVKACLEILTMVQELSRETEPVVGAQVSVRAAVHAGLVFVDPAEDEIYGLAANVAARLQTLAEPGTVVVSEQVRRLVDRSFALEPGPLQHVKGLDDPLQPFVVRRELPAQVRPAGRSLFVDRVGEFGRLRALWRQETIGFRPSRCRASRGSASLD